MAIGAGRVVFRGTRIKFSHWAHFLAICGRLAGHHLKLSLGSKALYVEFISYTQRSEPLKHPFEDLMDLLASQKS